ncbi:hypothetical protein [Agromyces sp. Marseille-P2726]|uniref:hypothetical protein n=1 Tax=Agromyces sp. Marseille-P2726 TaxID=2709132 RepID=UPI00157002AF|nr:hypothetical protein [Agromyces sp. Marseille-P2726]
MNHAHGYIAQTLHTSDELTAARINEQRRMAAERRADEGERAERTHRRETRLHRRAVPAQGRSARAARGLPAAH